MIIYLVLIIISIVLLGLVLIYLINRQQKGFGVLNSKIIYSDTDLKPGKIFYSKRIKLCGKPDYLIKDNGIFIPVEIKTGKTPEVPYENHTMQLMAYCFLVEENFGIRPPGGYIKYPEKEFKIAYTKEAEQSVIDVVSDILDLKRSNKEQHCEHKNHYI